MLYSILTVPSIRSDARAMVRSVIDQLHPHFVHAVKRTLYVYNICIFKRLTLL